MRFFERVGYGKELVTGKTEGPMKQHIKDLNTWLAKFKEGNPLAFKYVFTLYNRRLVYYADQLLKDTMEAEDVVADTFNKLLEKCADFNSTQHISGFLYTTTRNACLNQIRSNRRKEALYREFAYLVEDRDDVEQDMVEGELLNKIYAAMDTLPNMCRKIFKLFYLEGLTTREIAELLRISERNVLNQKSRAIKLLKIKLLLSSLVVYILQWLFK